MVRRRQRPAKEAASSSSGGASSGSGIPVDQALPLNVAGNLLEDQYFASPKRKDCRLMKVTQNGQLPEATMMAHNKDNKAGRTIGEYASRTF